MFEPEAAIASRFSNHARYVRFRKEIRQEDCSIETIIFDRDF